MSEMTESREIGFSDTSEISLCVIKSNSVSSGLYSRAIARADLLFARRMQRGHQTRHAAHERAHHAPSRPEPARTVREGRARRAQRLAGRGLGVRGMAARASQPRLSHRGP